MLDSVTAYLPDEEHVLVQARDGRAFTDPDVRAADDLARSLRDTVPTLRPPLDDPGLVSADGRSGLVVVQPAGPWERYDEHYDAMRSAVAAAAAQASASRRRGTRACPTRSTAASRTT